MAEAIQSGITERYDPTRELPALLAMLFILGMYLAFPTQEHYWDGVFFSQIIEDTSSLGPRLLHPNHLFFNVVGWIGYQGAIWAGKATRALYVLQGLNSVLSVGCAALVYLMLRSLTRDVFLSVSLVLTLAFGATWWKFSTDADAYIPSIFFLLIAFYLVLSGTKCRPLQVALAHSFAMFFHELAVLCFPALVLGLWFQSRALDLRQRRATVLKYVVTVVPLTVGVFGAGYVVSTGNLDLRGFLTWLTFYTPEHGFSFDPLVNLRLSGLVHRKLLFDGRADIVDRDAFTLVFLAALAASTAMFLWALVRGIRSGNSRFRDLFSKAVYSDPATLVCIAWTLPYLVFLFFFIPGNEFYRLFYFPAIIIFVGVIFTKIRRGPIVGRSRLGWISLAAMIFFANFIFFIRPYSKVRENSLLGFAMKANAAWVDPTVVVFDRSGAHDAYVRYFNPAAEWEELRFTTVDDFKLRTADIQRSGRAVWLQTNAVAEIRRRENGLLDSDSSLDLPKYGMEYVRVRSIDTGAEVR